jgi:hypothetical protein
MNTDSRRERFESVQEEKVPSIVGFGEGAVVLVVAVLGTKMADGHHRVISVANTGSS